MRVTLTGRGKTRRNTIRIPLHTFSPKFENLQSRNENKKLHPIRCLKGLEKNIVNKLLLNGIVLMKQLFEEEPSILSKKIGLRKKIIENLIIKAKNCCYMRKN